MTTAPRARILLFSLNLHVERSPLAQKIRKTAGICFQLFLPYFEPVSHMKNLNFLEFDEGEEERVERSILSYKCENLVLQKLVIVCNNSHIP